MDSHSGHFVNQPKGGFGPVLIEKALSITVFEPSYPSHPITFGDHIRKARMDTSLEIKELATLLGVNKTSIVNWELKGIKPRGKNLRAVEEWLKR